MRPLVHRIAARPWITAGAVAVVVLIAAGGYWLSDRGSGKSGASAAATTRLATASTSTIKQSVSASGTIEPAVDDSLSFSSSGVVTSVRVAEGDRVKRGAVLGTIDSAALKASLAEAKSTLASARAKVSADEDDSSTTSAQLAADKASVTAAKGQVSSAQTALDGAVITSPVTGVVAAVDVAVGDQVGTSGGSGSGSGGTGSGGSGSGGTGGGSGGTGSSSSPSTSTGSSSAAFEVIGTGSWLVNTSVDDTQVGLVAKGDQAQITTDSSTASVYGLVSSVAVVSSDSSGSASYPVVIDVTGSPSGLHAGATATVAIIYRQLNDVLTVPTLAVHDDGSSSYVYVSANGKQTKQTITVGAASGGLTQVTSGLRAGQQVVEQIARVGTGRSSSTTRNGNFGGGFPGGGFPGGGQFGGAPGGN